MKRKKVVHETTMMMMMSKGEAEGNKSTSEWNAKKLIENERFKVGVTQVNHQPILFK